MTGELTHENFVEMAMLPAEQRDRLQNSMDFIERITWREGETKEDAFQALYDIRKEASAVSAKCKELGKAAASSPKSERKSDAS